jgi:hypothetical protein
VNLFFRGEPKGRIMSLKSRVLIFFPAFVLLVSAVLVVGGLWQRNFALLISAPLFVYGFPLLCFRLHRAWYGPHRTWHRFATSVYCPWWGGHQMQLIFISFPFLETILRLIPGAYSSWLRLWGSKIGRGVYWTPQVEILDRDLLQVGDHVIFGHLVKVAAHVVTPRKDAMVLFIKTVSIGSESFVGAGSILGPGTQIPAATHVRAGAEYFNGKQVSDHRDWAQTRKPPDAAPPVEDEHSRQEGH